VAACGGGENGGADIGWLAAKAGGSSAAENNRRSAGILVSKIEPKRNEMQLMASWRESHWPEAINLRGFNLTWLCTFNRNKLVKYI